MARVKIDSKEVDFQNREDYRVRKKTRRMSRRMQNEKLRNKVLQDLFNRTTKQNKRWIHAIVTSPNRGGMSKEVEQALLAHMRKPEDQQKIPPALPLRPDKQGSIPDQRRLLTRLEEERNAAMKAQGQKIEVVDWWVSAGNEAENAKKTKQIRDLSALLESMEVEDEAVEEGREEDGGEDDETDGGVDLEASAQFNLPLRSK